MLGQSWRQKHCVSRADCLGTAPLRPAAMSGKSLLLKVILLGDGGVGKSSLMNRFNTGSRFSYLEALDEKYLCGHSPGHVKGFRVTRSSGDLDHETSAGFCHK